MTTRLPDQCGAGLPDTSRSTTSSSWRTLPALTRIRIEIQGGTSRSRMLVTARHVAMYLCRDHTTVINADRKIRSLMAERRSIYTQVTELTNRINQEAPGGLLPPPYTYAHSLWTTLWQSLG